MRKKNVLITVFLLVFFGAALADVVVQNDGTVHRGEIIYKDAEVVIIKTDDGNVLRLPRKDVLWITGASAKDAAAAQDPAGVSLDEAIGRLTDDAKAQLQASGAHTVAVAPFWGPGAAAVALNDVLGARVAQGLGGANCRAIAPADVERVIKALKLERSSLQDPTLAGRLANMLGADALAVGHISKVGAQVVTVNVVLVSAEGKALAEITVLIAKDAEVSGLLGEKKVEVRQPESTPKVQSAISTKFAPEFSLARFYHKYAANKPDAKLEGDRATWRLESGNKIVITARGQVTVVSNKKLTEEGQAARLESDLAGIFVKLGGMVEGYETREIHKDIEFDSVYYGDRAGVFHRFIVRERTDLTRRNWTLKKNGNKISYAKIALVIDGSWAKLSLGKSYVVSFGRWTARSATAAVQDDEDSVPIKIIPYGWIQWYVGVVDVVTEPTLTPPQIVGWGSMVIEHRSNQLIEHLQLDPERGARTSTEPEKKKSPAKVHTPANLFDFR
ncbi:MAG: hypothetical protein HQ592_00220 [Planctomycetes bacterium]|nr:hypothetical protein [Planctomycetota bacterium]